MYRPIANQHQGPYIVHGLPLYNKNSQHHIAILIWSHSHLWPIPCSLYIGRYGIYPDQAIKIFIYLINSINKFTHDRPRFSMAYQIGYIVSDSISRRQVYQTRYIYIYICLVNVYCHTFLVYSLYTSLRIEVFAGVCAGL
jgi:hypothetical protein